MAGSRKTLWNCLIICQLYGRPFPGEFTGASLKQHSVNISWIASYTPFPGEFTAAPLKRCLNCLVKRRRVEPSEFKPYRASRETEIGGNQHRFTAMECSIHSGTTFTHHLWQLAQ